MNNPYSVLCTEHENAFGEVSFSSKSDQILGNIMASADLLAQTADRTYLEKLPLLFFEFKEVGIGNYESELDFITWPLTDLCPILSQF